MPDTATILMLRHGQSEWNAIQRWQGTADSPLTALGREQAVETAWVLAGLEVRFGGLWSSDLSRASETASIIGEALCLGQPTLDPRLREADAGEWEGLTPELIEQGWPGWLAEHRRPATFEPFLGVVSRVVDALGDIARHAIASEHAAESPAALVVAHSGVIRSIIRQLGSTDERVPNLGGVWLHVSVIELEPLLVLGDLFDPSGIVISGVDAPGEDPGE